MKRDRECCNRCMWFGPVNQDGTMRKHRPARDDGTVGGRKVQDMSAEPCPGSHEPYARFNNEAPAPIDDTTQENPTMTEYGVFNDEGCVFIADTKDEAEAQADVYRAEDNGYWADLYSVYEMCPDHREEEQPKDGCEECASAENVDED
ncbi:hypothetical protein ACFUGD_01145 [Streptomyces sp. NPDC057217]|uniref:hypothetical protein n=1 Tax=Streptomyces sp. NPDC057217 TaxID=3346054 RepID=UPI00363F5AF3